jgi:glycosyltransferase involved in cell wall biosynthesis
MAVHNDARYLAAALESVLSQEGPPFVVVAVDDGSTDGSGALLDARAATDPRLRVVRQENAGLTRALVRGCAEARGALVARQDADDLSLPGRLRRQSEALLADERLAMVCCWARAIGPAGEGLWETRRPAEPELATDLLLNGRRGPPCHGTVVFRKAAYDAVGGYRPPFWFAQDGDLWLRLAEVGRLACVPECLYHFRVGEGSISARHRALQMRFGELAHVCRARRLRGEPEDDVLAEAETLARTLARRGPAARGRDGSAAYAIGRWLLRTGDPGAYGYLRQAAAAAPWNVKAWVSLLVARLRIGARPMS